MSVGIIPIFQHSIIPLLNYRWLCVLVWGGGCVLNSACLQRMGVVLQMA